jgi:hypothetical protein
MDQNPQKDVRTWVTFQTCADGSVQIVATGRNGTLTLNIDGGTDGPSMDIPIPNEEREPGKPYKYKAVWGLQANGHLKGWLAEDEGKIKWFPERAKRKPRKRPVRVQGTKR